MANQEFYLTLFTNSSGVLTKQLKMVHGKIESTAPKMHSGLAERVKLTLEQLPAFIANLRPNQCFAPGVMDTNYERVEVLAAKEFDRRGYDYPVHADETGVYGTRSSNSMAQKGPSLVLFDYDHDPYSEQNIDCPEKFLTLLDKAVPELDVLNTSYVRTYSTSTSLYDKETGKEIRPANGFHIYMVVEEGMDIKRFGKALEKRCWLAGMGHIKVSTNGNRLPRTIFDTNVHQPERLCFESGAFIAETEPFFQKLPNGEVKLKSKQLLKTTALKELSPEKEMAFQRALDEERNSEHVRARVAEYKDIQIQRTVNTTHYSDKPLTRKEAEKIVNAHENFILHPQDHLHFEDGRVVTVLEAFLRADEFDKSQLLDPLRPEKGYSRCMFYANRGEYGGTNPTINSFVEGGRTFQLKQSMNMFMSANHNTECQLEKYDTQAQILNSRYFPEINLKPGITLIKGEKGTGKTTTIKKHVIEAPGRVITINHLISLVSANAKQFELTDYNEIEGEQIHLLRMQPRLAICLNSVYKLQGQVYDTVVLDEFCQLLRAIKANTVDKPAACLKVLREIIATAKHVVCLDADLNKSFVDMARSPEFGIFDPETDIHVMINEYKPAEIQQRKVTLYQDLDGAPDNNAYNAMLIQSARDGGLFYATNSKGDAVKKTALIIQQLGGDYEIEEEHFISEVEGGRRVISITSYNSQSDEVQEFIKNLNDNLRDDDVLISSPSMGTGHSIDAIDGVARFNKTFGCFTKMAGNLPTDCLQHMSRVRECREFHVIIKDNKKVHPTNKIEIIHRDVYGQKFTIDNKLCVTHLQEYDMATKTFKINDYGWAEWYGELVAMENSLLNEFGYNLKQGLEREGYTSEFAYQRDNGEGSALSKRIEALGRTLSELERAKLRETPLISDEEHELLDSQLTLEPEERRKVFKKRASILFGALKNDYVLNGIVGMSPSAFNARRKALFLGANNDHLFLMDMLNRFNNKRADKDKTAMADHQILIRTFLGFLGIEFLNDVPSYDGRLLEPRFKLQAYDYLAMHRRDLRVLHGISFVNHKELPEISRFVGMVLRSIGLKYKRQRARSQGELVTNHYLDGDSVDRLREDILRAQQHSPTALFDRNIEVPTYVRAYMYQWQAGTAALSELYKYIGMLRPDVQDRLHRLLAELIQLEQSNAA